MNIEAFARDIKELVVSNVPVESDENFAKKHIKRGKKLIQAVSHGENVIPLGNKGYVYELGSEELEEKFPHYHILEDAYTIKKRGLGTKKSKGSQAQISDIGKRDYGKETVTYKKQKNGTYRRYTYGEYRRNVRGERKPKEKVIYKVDKRTGEVEAISVSNSYTNKHYHYIERALDNGLPFIAQNYGLKLKRVEFSDEDSSQVNIID